MKLNDIFRGLNYKIIQNSRDKNTDLLNDIEHNSKKIKPGDIFVALEGAISDGHKYIESAIKKGAKMIIASREVEVSEDIIFVVVDDLRDNLGIIASNYYGWPQDQLKIIGVTGTNGKTTTTYILDEILGTENTARLGTVENKVGNEIFETSNTTPESLDIVKICKSAVEKKLKYIIMEVSSHALEMGRVNMLKFDTCIFTNLTIDHLDFHKTKENYFEAKRKLFLKLKDKNRGVFNTEDFFGEKLYKEFSGIQYYGEKNTENESNDISFDKSNGNILHGEIIENNETYQVIKLHYKDEIYFLKTKLIGYFNMLNILGAISGALNIGIKLEDCLKKIENISQIPGRFEIVEGNQDFKVIVDFAHTGNALENVLEAVRKLAEPHKIITIFGCGGYKGIEKRFEMGKVSRFMSDYTILTTDNSNDEPIENIFKDIEKGFINNNNDLEVDKYEKIADRAEAIRRGIDLAKTGDIVLIAGKGHETTQTILGKTFEHNDKEEAKKYLIEKFGK